MTDTLTRPAPHPYLLQIAPYKGGKSAVEGRAKIVKLSSNENPHGPSPKALRAIEASLPALARYPDGSYSALRAAIAGVYGLEAETLVCGAGSDELIGLLTHCYVGEGDEVLYSQYGFLMYKLYAQGFGAKPVAAAEKGARADVDALLAAVTPRTKILFLANPNNPTGSYLTKEELARLRAGLRPDILLAMDGAYAEYADAPDYASGLEMAKATPNTVYLGTFSKIYGLAALRLGWACCPPEVADALNRARSPFNVSAIASAAGVAAVEDVEYTALSRKRNVESRAWLAAELGKLPLKVHPSLGNFLLAGFRDAKQAENANKHLLSEGIIVRDVLPYGLPNDLRITVGTDEECREVAAALGRFFEGV